MKKISLFMAALLLFSAFSLVFIANTASARGSGDVDFDGYVNQYDYIDIERYLNGEKELSEEQLANGDVSGDGKITFYDYSLIRAEYMGLLDASEVVMTDVEDDDACKAGIEAQNFNNVTATHYVAGDRLQILVYVTNPSSTSKDFLELELSYDTDEFTFERAYSESGRSFFYIENVDENDDPVGKVSAYCNDRLTDETFNDMPNCFVVIFTFMAKESGKNASTFAVDNVKLCSYGYRTRYLIDSASMDLPKSVFDVNTSSSMSNLVAEEKLEATIEICNITTANGLDKITFDLTWGGDEINGGFSPSVLKLLSNPASDDCIVTRPEGWEVALSKNANGFIDVIASATEGAAPMTADDKIVIKLEFETAKSASNSVSLSVNNVAGELDGAPLYGRADMCTILQYGLVYQVSEDGTYFIVYGNHGAPSQLVIPETATYYGITRPVKEIQSGAFFELELDSLTIPASIEYISGAAFDNCTIADIYCEYSKAPYTWEEGCFDPCGATVHWGDVEPKPMPEPAPDPVKLGDINGDGVINQYDYILVKRHYFGTRILTDSELLCADVNGDAKVDQFDYILICRHYFGTYVIGG